MDIERAVARVRDLRDVAENMKSIEDRFLRVGDVYGYLDDPVWKGLNSRLAAMIGGCERIARAVEADVADRLRAGYSDESRHVIISTCDEIEGRLLTDSEIEEIVGPRGPQLAAANLHPWIWNAAVDLWANGHYREAVQTAATTLLDSHLPAKLGRARDTNGGKDLAAQAFNAKDSDTANPRLRLPGYNKVKDPKSWTSAHEGAMYLGMGAAQYIRNLTTHDTTKIDEQHGLEMLATLSLFARLVDLATVER